MEEKLREFIGKKVHITFESKQHNKIYNLTGILTSVDDNWQWAHFTDATSDYPIDHEIEMVNKYRIRTVEEVSND
jgi:ribosome maturation factor RimP